MAKRRGAPSLGVALFAALAVLSVAAFAVTRAVRSADDLVNTVELAKTLAPGGDAFVRFTLAEPDSSVDVLIIDGRSDATVRRIATGEDLPAGPVELSWDGTTEADKPARPGLYAIRVILGEQGRDILPPGRIRVLEGAPKQQGGKPGAKQGPGANGPKRKRDRKGGKG